MDITPTTPQHDARGGAGWPLFAVKLLFWDWRAGRIGRLTYLAATGAVWAALWGMVHLMLPPTLEEAMVPVDASPLAPLAGAVVGVLALAASMNLAAKRFRDIGLPGWLSVLGLTVLHTALLFTVPGLIYPWFGLAVLAVLVLTPTGALASRG